MVKFQKRSTTTETPPPLPDRIIPNSVDVMLGRGKSFRNNPELIQANQVRYSKSSNTIKRGITTEIMCTMNEASGRFVRWSDKNNQWTVISATEAHQKIAHAIQYRLRHYDSSQDNTQQSDEETSAINEAVGATVSELKVQWSKQQQRHQQQQQPRNCFDSRLSRILSVPTSMNQLHSSSIPPNDTDCSTERQLQPLTLHSENDDGCDTVAVTAMSSDYLMDSHNMVLSSQLPPHHINSSIQQQQRGRDISDCVSHHRPSEQTYDTRWGYQYHFNAGNIDPYTSVNDNYCGDWGPFPTMYPLESVCDPQSLQLLPQLSHSSTNSSTTEMCDIGVSECRTTTFPPLTKFLHNGNDGIAVSHKESWTSSKNDIASVHADIIAFCCEPTVTATTVTTTKKDIGKEFERRDNGVSKMPRLSRKKMMTTTSVNGPDDLYGRDRRRCSSSSNSYYASLVPPTTLDEPKCWDSLASSLLSQSQPPPPLPIDRGIQPVVSTLSLQRSTSDLSLWDVDDESFLLLL